jgi:hypothetical protein
VLLTLLGIATDIMLGALAYRLARRVERMQETQMTLLTKLVGRVEAIETHVYKPLNGIGYIRLEE